MAHVSENKKKTVDRIAKLIADYPIVGAVNMENLPAPQLQTMRAQLRGKVEIFMAKRRLIRIAIEKVKEKKQGIEGLEKHLKGMPALIFTKDNPFTLFKTLKKSKSKAPAKAGQTAPNDIIVKAGPTPFAPGPIIGELGSLGIKCGVEGGKVAIKEDSIVAKEGEKISPKQAELLTRLGIEPMEVGLGLTATYEDGTIFTKDILDIDEEKFRKDLDIAAVGAINLSINAGYPTKDNISLMIGKAFNDAKALGIEQNIIDEGIIDEILAKAARQMHSLKNTANIEIVEKKTESKQKIEKAEKKEEKILQEEKKIIDEEKKLEKQEQKVEAPIEKEARQAVKEEEEKKLEAERIQKEKELEKTEKAVETDKKVDGMVKKMKQFASGKQPNAEKILDDVKKEEEPEQKDKEHKEAEELTKELLKKGTLRK